MDRKFNFKYCNFMEINVSNLTFYQLGLRKDSWVRAIQAFGLAIGYTKTKHGDSVTWANSTIGLLTPILLQSLWCSRGLQGPFATPLPQLAPIVFSIWIDEICKCLCTITCDFLGISLNNFVIGLCVSNKRYLFKNMPRRSNSTLFYP